MFETADERLLPVATVPSTPERDRLCVALIRLTAEGGYDGLSAEEIAARAGVEPATFQRHFRDREDCLDQIWDAMTLDLISRLWSAELNGETWRSGLRLAAYTALHYFTEDDTRSRFFMIDVLATGEMATARRDRLFQAAVDLVDLGRNELEDPNSMSRARAEAVLGAIHDRIASGVREASLEGDAGIEAVRQMMYVAVRPYLGHEAALEELSIGPPVEVQEVA